MLWENLRSDEFKEAVEKSNGVCIIPIGCVEAHGIHLPLGCDTLKAREFCVRAAEIELAARRFTATASRRSCWSAPMAATVPCWNFSTEPCWKSSRRF